MFSNALINFTNLVNPTDAKCFKKIDFFKKSAAAIFFLLIFFLFFFFVPVFECLAFEPLKIQQGAGSSGVTIEVDSGQLEGYTAFISPRGGIISRYILKGKRYSADPHFIDDAKGVTGISGLGSVSLSNQVFPGELSNAVWDIQIIRENENQVKAILKYISKELYSTPQGEMKNPLSGLEFTKTFIFKSGSFSITMLLQIKNPGSDTLQVLNSANQLGFITYLGGALAGDSMDDKPVLFSSGKIIEKEPSAFNKTPMLEMAGSGKNIEWAGIRDRYYAAVIIPDRKVIHAAVSGALDADSNKSSMAGLAFEGFELAAGETRSYVFTYYAGPKDRTRLKNNNIGQIFEPGFWSLKLAVIEVLSFFYKYTKSWGWSIVILTIFLKIILYPLMVKQTKSMHVMQKLQPQIKKLQEKYKDDSAKMNQEMMELYRKNNANPFGGCFPLLVQLPILFALFTALQESVEIKGASFFWLADLSLPDKNILIPGTAMAFPLLPLIIAVSMHYQQKSMSADPNQAKMMAFMPVMMFFICQALPSGVLIYWLVSNVLSMWQQERIKASLENGDSSTGKSKNDSESSVNSNDNNSSKELSGKKKKDKNKDLSPEKKTSKKNSKKS
jgi:YidC/Oxa1 family membrane protein insertase